MNLFKQIYFLWQFYLCYCFQMNNWHFWMKLFQSAINNRVKVNIPSCTLINTEVKIFCFWRIQTSIYNPCTNAPSLGGIVISSLIFLVTSHMRHIWSRGSSFFLAVLCMMAVKNDWGLKNPGSHTEEGRLKSEVHPSNSFILSSKSAYQADSPFRDA